MKRRYGPGMATASFMAVMALAPTAAMADSFWYAEKVDCDPGRNTAVVVERAYTDYDPVTGWADDPTGATLLNGMAQRVKNPICRFADGSVIYAQPYMVAPSSNSHVVLYLNDDVVSDTTLRDGNGRTEIRKTSEGTYAITECDSPFWEQETAKDRCDKGAIRTQRK